MPFASIVAPVIPPLLFNVILMVESSTGFTSNKSLLVKSPAIPPDVERGVEEKSSSIASKNPNGCPHKLPFKVTFT